MDWSRGLCRCISCQKKHDRFLDMVADRLFGYRLPAGRDQHHNMAIGDDGAEKELGGEHRIGAIEEALARRVFEIEGQLLEDLRRPLFEEDAAEFRCPRRLGDDNSEKADRVVIQQQTQEIEAEL